MRSIALPLLLLTGCATSSSVVRDTPARTYQTRKDLASLEKCLTNSLSKLDDVYAVNSEGTTTLMFGERTKPRMLIDLSPPRVAVTTNFAPGTRDIVEACI
jgi:hypothetical protein